MLPSLPMNLLACLCFLVPPRLSRIRLIYVLKPREELSLCHANLSRWLCWKCVALIWWFSWSFPSLHSAHRRKYFFKSASFFHFNMFSSIFITHSFSDTELAQWGNKLWWSILYDATGTFITIWRATSMFPTLLNSVSLTSSDQALEKSLGLLPECM